MAPPSARPATAAALCLLAVTAQLPCPASAQLYHGTLAISRLYTAGHNGCGDWWPFGACDLYFKAFVTTDGGANWNQFLQTTTYNEANQVTWRPPGAVSSGSAAAGGFGHTQRVFIRIEVWDDDDFNAHDRLDSQSFEIPHTSSPYMASAGLVTAIEVTWSQRCPVCSAGQYSPDGCSCSNCRACGGDQYEAVPCTADSDRECASCSAHAFAACPAGQVRTGSCGAGAVSYACRGCRSCAAGEYVVRPCSGVDDTACATCSSCNADEYETRACQGGGSALNDRQCASCDDHAFADCLDGNFRVGTCGDGASTYRCQGCTRCTATEFIGTACTGVMDTQCVACTACSPGEYEASPCTADADRVCAPCSAAPGPACPEGTFRTSECMNGDVDHDCLGCRVCGPGEYESSACQAGGVSNDRTCAACSEHPDALCPAGTFRRGECGGGGSTFECVPCSGCTPGATFLTAECSTGADAVCAACTVCAAGEAAVSLCTAAADTQCAPLDGLCGASDFWDLSESGIGSCKPCLAHPSSGCPVGQRRIGSCGGGVADYSCVPCAECASDEWERDLCQAGGDPTADTVCVPCSDHPDAECAPGTFRAGSCGGGSAGYVCERCSPSCDLSHFVSQECSATADTVCTRCTPCAADEYEAAACQSGAPTADRECASCDGHPSAQCGAGTYRTGSCGSGDADHDCVACRVCGASEYATSQCQEGGPSNDAQCRDCISHPNAVCPTGTYRAGSCGGGESGYECVPCSGCGDGEFVSAECSATADTVCSACTGCGAGEYEDAACQAGGDSTADRTCTSCSEFPFYSCPAGQYRTGDCNFGVVTYSCSPCQRCAAGNYAASECTATSDAVCSACSACASTEYEVSPCQAAADRECASCASSPFRSCLAGEYRAGTCGNGVDDYSCPQCSACTGGAEWASGGCAGAQDTICSNCTVCGDGEAEMSPCTLAADRTCSPAASGSAGTSESLAGIIAGSIVAVIVLVAAVLFFAHRKRAEAGQGPGNPRQAGAFDNPAYVAAPPLDPYSHLDRAESYGDAVYDNAIGAPPESFYNTLEILEGQSPAPSPGSAAPFAGGYIDVTQLQGGSET